jgi:tetratricopeptide (TPR) repeat protein
MTRRSIVSVLLLVGCTAAQQDVKMVKDVSPLEKEFAQKPDDPKVNLELGDRAMAGGDWLRAEQYYQRAEALGTPEAVVVPRIIKVLVMGRRYDDALERCHRRLQRTPADRATRLVEAAILEALERPHEAERELTALVRTRPNDPNPYLALGKLYRDSYHDVTRARAMFEKYLALAPKSDEADSLRYQLEDSAPPPTAPTQTPAETSTP